jgi:hypothetical protein
MSVKNNKKMSTIAAVMLAILIPLATLGLIGLILCTMPLLFHLLIFAPIIGMVGYCMIMSVRQAPIMLMLLIPLAALVLLVIMGPPMPSIAFPFICTTGIFFLMSIPGGTEMPNAILNAIKGDKQAREGALFGFIIYLLINGFIILCGIVDGQDIFAPMQ